MKGRAAEDLLDNAVGTAPLVISSPHTKYILGKCSEVPFIGAREIEAQILLNVPGNIL